MSSRSTHTPFILVLTLALTMMLGPFSMDTYLPAFPAIAKSLSVSQAAVTLTVSVYIFTTAFSQLIGGALSDRLGRQPVLIGGLLVFMVSSLWLALVPSLAQFLGGRVAQAMGAGFVLVSVPAMVRDRVSGQEGARLFSLLGLMIVLAPGVAPSIGGLVLSVGSWRWIYVLLLIYALALIPLLRATLFSARYRVDPTPAPKHEEKPSFWQQYALVLKQKEARIFIFWQAFSFSTLMLFITRASSIYQVHFKQSEHMFGLLFGANVVVMFLVILFNRWLLLRVHALKILRTASILQGLGGILMITAAASDWGLWAFLPTVMFTIGAMAAISPNMQACFMEYFPRNGGTAAAILGSNQFFFAGVLSAASSLLPHSLLAVCGAIGCSALISALFGIRSLVRGY